MGYRSYWAIEFWGDDSHRAAKTLYKLSGYEPDIHDGYWAEGMGSARITWSGRKFYNWRDVFRQIADEFGGVLIWVHRVAEDDGRVWRAIRRLGEDLVIEEAGVWRPDTGPGDYGD